MIFLDFRRPQGPTRTANGYFSKFWPPAGPYKELQTVIFHFACRPQGPTTIANSNFSKRFVLLSFGFVASSCFIVFVRPDPIFLLGVSSTSSTVLTAHCLNSLLVLCLKAARFHVMPLYMATGPVLTPSCWCSNEHIRFQSQRSAYLWWEGDGNQQCYARFSMLVFDDCC